MNSDLTILETKKYLKQNLHKGITCPCCNQFVKAYKRKIRHSLAYGLINLFMIHETNEFHLEDELRRLDLKNIVRSDFPKLRFWNLIEKIKGKRDDGSSKNGFYKITQLGRRFVFNEVAIPKYIFLQNNELITPLDDDIELVKIEDCFEKYNYNEMFNYITKISDANKNNF